MSVPDIEIVYIEGGAELLPLAEPLWKELNRMLQSVNEQFSEEIANKTFGEREAELRKKSDDGRMLRVALAKTAAGERVGYCIATIDRDQTGEVDSFFVQPAFRGRGIGDALMRKTLSWMDAAGAKSKVLEVTWGNERVWPLYRRHGFLPRYVRFVRKETPGGPP